MPDTPTPPPHGPLRLATINGEVNPDGPTETRPVFDATLDGFVNYLREWADNIQEQVELSDLTGQEQIRFAGVTSMTNGLYRHHYNNGGTSAVGMLSWGMQSYAQDMDM